MKPFPTLLSPARRRTRRFLTIAFACLAVVAPTAAAPPTSATLDLAAGHGVTRELLPNGTTLVSVPLVAIDRTGSEVAPGREFSPAGCRIVYVDNPHFAASVPGAIKVNAKVQCNAPVQTLSLGVNMTNTTIGERAAGPKNVTKDQVPYLDNFNTYVVCTDARLFQFQGDAGAVSVENGRGYANVAFGNVSKPLPCGYGDA